MFNSIKINDDMANPYNAMIGSYFQRVHVVCYHWHMACRTLPNLQALATSHCEVASEPQRADVRTPIS